MFKHLKCLPVHRVAKPPSNLNGLLLAEFPGLLKLPGLGFA
ncbi:uncharacterized protein METZ01_LOCUS104921 [marine metagenome]|uniref:Uncharacterized protein n=1 Tax=marine metagenome TaxID=408172 RepID=A0A381WJC5_9ZZZZ